MADNGETKQINALVVEGGAMRGIFAAGVLDYFMEEGFNPFDLYYGVSAGATNIASYLANKKGRNYKIYTDYAVRPEFISIKRFLKGGHLMDLDWLWEITLRELPLNPELIPQANGSFYIGMTNIDSAEPEYKEASAEDVSHYLKVSSALPVMYRDYPIIDNSPMTDGGLADAIPVAKAMNDGANRIMVLRSRPKSYTKKLSLFDRLLGFRFRHHKKLNQLIRSRADNYNQTVALIRQPHPATLILEICPPDDFAPTRFAKSTEKLDQGYLQGKASAKEAIERWNRQINDNQAVG